MSLRPDEVSAIIQQELKKYTTDLEMESRGSVLQVGDGIARVWGLEDAMAGELLEFTGGIIGMVLNLEEDNVGAVLFGSDMGIKEGDTVRRTGKVAQIPVGEALIGRVVDPLGQPLDTKGPIVTVIEPAPIFWRAEESHQRYLEKHGRGACKLGGG